MRPPTFSLRVIVPMYLRRFSLEENSQIREELLNFQSSKRKKKCSFSQRTAKICTSTKEQGNEVIVNCKKAAMIFHFFCCYLLLFSTAYFFISFLTSPNKSLKKVWAETKCCQIHSNCHKAKP